ncbi:MAG: hypothetical protein ABIA47_02865 [bacterium]
MSLFSFFNRLCGKSFTGQYGFVAIPDVDTRNDALEMGNAYDGGAEFTVKHPHITLFQAPVADIPRGFVLQTLNSLQFLVHHEVTHNEVGVFFDNWVLWLTDKDDEIMRAHSIARKMSDFLDQLAATTAANSAVGLTIRERDLVRKHGTFLVGTDYMPHITLAHAGSDIEARHKFAELPGTIVQVAFVEFGEHGTIKRVIESVQD